MMVRMGASKVALLSKLDFLKNIFIEIELFFSFLLCPQLALAKVPLKSAAQRLMCQDANQIGQKSDSLPNNNKN